MNLESAQIQYMQDTLGVREVLMPHEANVVSSDTEDSSTESWSGFVLGSQRAKVLVATQRDLRAAEEELIRKILGAVGENDFCLLKLPDSGNLSWSSASSLENKVILVFSDLVSGDLSSQIQQGSLAEFDGSRVLLTAELDGMLHGSAQQIQAHKRKVWADIQPLKV